MARRVTWSEIASKDLEECWEYIARDSLMYAASFVRDVRESSRSLDESAERGRIVPEFKLAGVRELIVGNYRLVYQVGPESVVILRVIHGARRMPGSDLRRRDPPPG